jgi:DNA-binding transcriptional ArsR family regulator
MGEQTTSIPRDRRGEHEQRAQRAGAAVLVERPAVVPLDEGLRAELTELTATLCRALNDPKRLLILHALADGPLSVGTLAELVEATTANVSQHLAVLRERGLVDSQRDGLNVIYSLRYPELIATIAQLRAVLRTELQRRMSIVS